MPSLDDFFSPFEDLFKGEGSVGRSGTTLRDDNEQLLAQGASGAATGASLGRYGGPLGVLAGTAIGLGIGITSGAKADRAKRDAERDTGSALQRLNRESETRQAGERAQRLALLGQGQRFEQGGQQSQQTPSALSPIAESGVQPITNKRQSPSGTF